MFKNSIRIVFILIFILLTLGSVYAIDNETVISSDFNSSIVEISDNEVLSQDNLSDDSSLLSNYETLSEEWSDEENKVSIDVEPFTVDLNSKKWFEVHVNDFWGNPVDSGYITFNWNGFKYKLDVDDGVARSYIYASNKITTKTVTVKYIDDENYYDSASVQTTFKTVKANAFIENGSPYQFNENYYHFWLFSKNGGAGVEGIKLKIKVKIGKKYKTIYKKTGGSGHVVLHINGLNVGKHNVIITSLNKNVKLKTYKSFIVVKKAKINIKTSSNGKYIKIKAKDIYGDAAKKIKIKVKLYTGKHYKAVIVKTNKKGIAKVYVGGLSNGVYHKVKYSSASKNYYIRDYDGDNLDYVILSRGKALPLWGLP